MLLPLNHIHYARLLLPGSPACMHHSHMRSHHMGRMDAYCGERGECGLIIAILEFPDTFLEFHAPSLCHSCAKRGRGSELTRLYLAAPNTGIFGHSKIM